MFKQLSNEFSEFHQVDVNVFVHLLTVCGFYVSLISMAGCYAAHCVFVYTISLLYTSFSAAVWLSSFILIGMLILSESLELTFEKAALLFFISYVTQDLAHYFCSEPTFQSTYYPTSKTSMQSWVSYYKKLSLHTLFMLPLVIDSSIKINLFEKMLSWFLVRDRIVRIQLTSLQEKSNLKLISNWLDSQELSKNRTSHWWYNSLPIKVQTAFSELANSCTVFHGFEKFFDSPLYSVKVLNEMNEVYVATVNTSEATSDNVFYSNHVDGPWMFFPFCSVYRSIIAVNKNDAIKTSFIASGSEKVLDMGDMWAFDFNREIHKISQVKEPTHFRYSLKAHYLVYPTSLRYYGEILAFLTTTYNTIARLAFLTTLQPKNWIQKALWKFIMLCTETFFTVISAAGNSGAFSFVLISAILKYFFPTDIPVFLISTSFIHYLIYISTYYFSETHRDLIPFRGFKQTVMFYKAIAFCHLMWNYILTAKYVDLVSLGMIVFGFGLSGAAANAIGIDRTYFAVELGILKENRVSGFPYSLTPHPMIIGNIIGLLGFAKNTGLTQKFPYLIPAHILLYTIHMFQEHFELKKKSPIKL